MATSVSESTAVAIHIQPRVESRLAISRPPPSGAILIWYDMIWCPPSRSSHSEKWGGPVPTTPTPRGEKRKEKKRKTVIQQTTWQASHLFFFSPSNLKQDLIDNPIQARRFGLAARQYQKKSMYYITVQHTLAAPSCLSGGYRQIILVLKPLGTQNNSNCIESFFLFFFFVVAAADSMLRFTT